MIIQEQGTHGTSKTRADAIEKSKIFSFGKEGRRGSGAYFWRHSPFCVDLAFAWAEQAKADGKFKYDPWSDVAVLEVDLDCDETSYLDLTDPDTSNKIHQLVKRLGGTKLPPKELHRAYDFAISEIAKQRKAAIKLLRVSVNPPAEKYCGSFYNVLAYGWPICLILRDNGIIKDIRRVG